MVALGVGVHEERVTRGEPRVVLLQRDSKESAINGTLLACTDMPGRFWAALLPSREMCPGCGRRQIHQSAYVALVENARRSSPGT